MDIMQSTLPVHVLIQLSPSLESFPALLVRTTTVKQTEEMKLNNVTTLMILSGMVRGRMSVNCDRGCLNQLRMTLSTSLGMGFFYHP